MKKHNAVESKVREIRRKTRKRYSAEEKIRIVLEGLRGEGSIAALCRRAGLFVGSDTGPMHLAVAVGTPTISLHGPSRAAWCGAYGPGNRALQARYDSSKKRRLADNAAMRAISVDSVCKACDKILGDRQARKHRA